MPLARRAARMSRKPIWQALAGIALLVVGVLWTYAGARGYEEKRVNAVAGACRVDMTIIQKRDRRRQPRSRAFPDRKSTRLNSSHLGISYAVFCLKKKNQESVTRTSHEFEPDNLHD